jgi:hypothetical protein
MQPGVTVEHDDVVAVRGGVRDGIAAVEDDVDSHPLAPQARGDGLGQPGVVLDDEHSHEIPLPGCQSQGDSRVTAPVTMLSPPAAYNLGSWSCTTNNHGEKKRPGRGSPLPAQRAGQCGDGPAHSLWRWSASPYPLPPVVEVATALHWLISVRLPRPRPERPRARALRVARRTKQPSSTPSACEKTASLTSPTPTRKVTSVFKGGPGGNGVNPNSSQFQAAQQACKSLAPAPPTPGQSSDFMAQALKFSGRMRKNGVPNFPDPTEKGSTVAMTITGVNPGTPQFQKAMRACQSLLPGGGPPAP